MEFKDRLRRVFDFKGITAYKAAKDIGVAVNTIHRYLKGDGIPNGKKTTILTSYLGVSSDWLLKGIGEMKISESDFIAATEKEVDTSYLGFKDRLNEAINLAGVTPYRIAKDTGIANTTLSTYRNRDVKPNIANAKILATYLGVSPDWLLYDAGEMRANKNDHLLVDSSNIEDICIIGRDNSGDIANAHGVINKNTVSLSLPTDGVKKIIKPDTQIEIYLNAQVETLKQKIAELERVITLKDDMIQMKDEMISSLRDTIDLLKRQVGNQ